LIADAFENASLVEISEASVVIHDACWRADSEPLKSAEASTWTWLVVVGRC
jgi:hypothetical protein